MIEAATIAGFLTAHAVLSISGGETLLPIYGYINENGEQVGVRMDKDTTEECVAEGLKILETNPHNTSAAVFIYDTRITLNSSARPEKVDALTIEFISYKEEPVKIVFRLPYTHNNPAPDAFTKTEFAIYDLVKDKLPENIQEDEEIQMFKAFCDGASSHEQGSDIWMKHQITVPANDGAGEYGAGIINKNSPLWIRENMPETLIEYDGIPEEKYDDASWHDNDETLPESATSTHIGMFVAWCLLNNLEGEEVTEININKLKNRTSPPGEWLYDYYCGVFAPSFLNEEGNNFTKYYYESCGDYIEDYGKHLCNSPEMEDLFNVPDTWKSYDTLDPIIKKRFEEWKG